MSAVRATIRYNLLRLAMVVLVGGVCFLLGARGPMLLVLALVISLPVSFVTLAGHRKAMIEEIAAGRLGNPLERAAGRFERGAAAEDAILDAAEAEAARAAEAERTAESDAAADPGSDDDATGTDPQAER